MSADITIPQEYWLHLGSVDVGLDDIRINNIPKITVDAGLSDIRINRHPQDHGGCGPQ